MLSLLKKLKGRDRFETWENFCILFLVVGVACLGVGIGFTILTPVGLPAILAMLGALISFVAVVALVLGWLARELVSE